MPTLSKRFQHAWNAFFGRDPTDDEILTTDFISYGPGYSYRPDRPRLYWSTERTTVSTIYNQIALDVASVDIEHVRLDDDGRYVETIKSGLNNCLTLDTNIDQTGRAFIMDVVMSMCDEGCVAIVPVDTTEDPRVTGSYDILTMRTGKIIQWYPYHVKVRVYNERIGEKVDIIVPKESTAIIENPLYAVMNEPNSTLQRLIRTLNKLDVVNEQNASGKLDLIIQLPYVIKSKSRQDQAELRRKQIEDQLSASKYGIAYTDGTERITQLNRAVDNNLWTQAKELTSMLYNQLGMTESVFNGTADEHTMNLYYARTIDPFLSAISEEIMRKFLTKTARTQGQAIRYYRDPFRLVSVSNMAEIADKFTRNEILSSNEVRTEIGFKPSDQPGADDLRNKNLNQQVMMEEELPPEEAQGTTDQEADYVDAGDYYIDE